MATLFASGKIGCLVESYRPMTEKRSDGEVTVLAVRFRVEPFDAILARLLDDGVGPESSVRSTVFTLNAGEPRASFTRHDFNLDLSRQNLHLHVAPDTETARVALLQATISRTHVRLDRGTGELVFLFSATFGPVDRDQLELLQSAYHRQVFIRFEEAEPLLDLEDDGAGTAGPTVVPMFDDVTVEVELAGVPEPMRHISKRHASPKARAAAKQRRAR